MKHFYKWQALMWVSSSRWTMRLHEFLPRQLRQASYYSFMYCYLYVIYNYVPHPAGCDLRGGLHPSPASCEHPAKNLNYKPSPVQHKPKLATPIPTTTKSAHKRESPTTAPTSTEKHTHGVTTLQVTMPWLQQLL